MAPLGSLSEPPASQPEHWQPIETFGGNPLKAFAGRSERPPCPLTGSVPKIDLSKRQGYRWHASTFRRVRWIC